jgi:rhamnogalacturonyl hydrolase YesR
MLGYRTMMAALLKYQGDDGLWRQLIDHPGDAWPETSGTGMFTFAMVTGVKNGWLDGKTFGPAARKAWLGLVTYLDAGCEREQRLRRHQQGHQRGLLSGAPAQDRGFARAGGGLVERDGVAALTSAGR